MATQRATTKTAVKVPRRVAQRAATREDVLAIYRRENLRALIKQRGANALAASLGYSNASFLSQMAGPHPIREVSAKTARRFEEMLDLPEGYLDTAFKPVVMRESANDAPARPAPALPTSKQGAPQQPEQASVGLTANIIRLVGRLFDEEGVDVSAVRFADVVALAIVDAVEHDEQARPEHVRSLVRLVKPLS